MVPHPSVKGCERNVNSHSRVTAFRSALAVISHVFGERYNSGADEVSAIVLSGNIAAVLVIPVVLAVVV